MTTPEAVATLVARLRATTWVRGVYPHLMGIADDAEAAAALLTTLQQERDAALLALRGRVGGLAIGHEAVLDAAIEATNKITAARKPRG